MDRTLAARSLFSKKESLSLIALVALNVLLNIPGVESLWNSNEAEPTQVTKIHNDFICIDGGVLSSQEDRDELFLAKKSFKALGQSSSKKKVGFSQFKNSSLRSRFLKLWVQNPLRLPCQSLCDSPSGLSPPSFLI